MRVNRSLTYQLNDRFDTPVIICRLRITVNLFQYRILSTRTIDTNVTKKLLSYPDKIDKMATHANRSGVGRYDTRTLASDEMRLERGTGNGNEKLAMGGMKEHRNSNRKLSQPR